MRARQVRRLRTRAGWTIIDQILSSVTNFGLGLVVARRVGADAYGAFAIGFTVYALTIGVSRALASDPLVIRFSDRGLDEQRTAARSSAATGLVVGLAVGAVLAGVGLGVGGVLRGSLLAFAVALPLTTGQDPYRYEFFAARRPHLAALSDLVWLLLLVGFVAALLGADATTPGPYVLVWAVGAAGGIAVGVVFSGGLPAVGRVRAWLRDHRDLNFRLGTEFLMLYGGPQVVILAVGVIAGYDDAGGLRGALVLLGPLIIVATGLVTAAVPEGVRLRDHDIHRLRRSVLALAAVLGTAVAVWSVIVWQLPDRVGEELLGATWPEARDVMLPIGLTAAGGAASIGLTAGLRSLGAARRAVRAAAPGVALLLIGGITGAVVGDGRGAALGMVIPSWIGVLLYLRQFRQAIDDVAAGRAPARVDEAAPVEAEPSWW